MEFVKWSSIPRLSKEKMRITEKIDGTNSAIRIRPTSAADDTTGALSTIAVSDDIMYNVWVQSRNRFITPGKSTDNAGFAGWVWDNLDELVSILGPGDHYGEWWGSGIQRGYGLTKGEKRFSLFNAERWFELLHPTEDKFDLGLYTVPLLYTGQYDGAKIQELKQDLIDNGSKAAPGYKSEGLIVELKEIGAKYKVLCENDDIHKWELKSA